MTGEITLRGEVLPIGGLKEKLLAAHRGGITTVLIPDDNTKDLAEIPDNIKEKLDIRSVKWIDEVLQVALTHMPTPVADGRGETAGGDRRREAPAQACARQEPGEGALADRCHQVAICIEEERRAAQARVPIERHQAIRAAENQRKRGRADARKFLGAVRWPAGEGIGNHTFCRRNSEVRDPK